MLRLRFLRSRELPEELGELLLELVEDELDLELLLLLEDEDPELLSDEL